MRKKSTHKQSVPEVIINNKKREEKTNTNKRNGMFLVFLITIPFKKGASYPSPILHRMGKKLSATPTLLMVIVRMMIDYNCDDYDHGDNDDDGVTEID